MITSWTVFVIVAILFILLIMALTAFIMKKLGASLKAMVPVVLLVGLIVGGASFGYVSATQGSHFMIVHKDLTTESFYSLGENKYKLSDGSEVNIPKMKNIIINDSGKELMLEEVIYGSVGHEPFADIIDPGVSYDAPGFLPSIYLFDDVPPESITTEKSGEVKYWLTVYEEDEMMESDSTEVAEEE